MVAWLGSALLAGGLVGAWALQWRPDGAPAWAFGSPTDPPTRLPWDAAWRSLGFALLLPAALRLPLGDRAARWAGLACLMLAIAAIAASRVAGERSGGAQPMLGALAEARGGKAASPIVGRWRPGPAVDPWAEPGCDVAHVGGIAWSVPRGHLDDGDWVAFLAPPREAKSARGLVPGPRERRGASSRSTCRPDEVLRLARESLPCVAELRAAARELRGRILARCDELRDEEARGLVAALLVGDVRRLEPERIDLYVRTGTYHVLAVSGLQVALLAALCVLPLARLACLGLSLCVRWKPPAEPLALALLLAFAAIVGGGAPIVRATACFA
ncbi:MAG: Competence protein, partial [Planctomycetota bacterium]